jgi:hypothetical protein
VGEGRVSRDRIDVPFTGAEAGTEPLTWGEKAILQDMRASGNQFSMGGRLDLPAGSTVADAAARLSGLVVRHSALRTRLETDSAGRLSQDVAGSGQLGLDILTVPRRRSVDVAQYAAELMDTGRSGDWLPSRLAAADGRGQAPAVPAGAGLVLSHLVAVAVHTCCSWMTCSRMGTARRPASDVARSEQTPTASAQPPVMRHWENSLRHIRRRHSAGPPARRTRPGRYCAGRSRPPPTWPCRPSPGTPGPTPRELAIM